MLFSGEGAGNYPTGGAGLYGNGPRGGVVRDPPFKKGGVGVVWDTPYLQPLLASHFQCGAKRPKFLCPFK